MHSCIQWLTVDDRGVQGVTGDDRDVQWQTGSVYRSAQGMAGYTMALNSDTQGMYRGWQ